MCEDEVCQPEPYRHLTVEQLNHLGEVLFGMMHDNCRDDEYLRAVLQEHINQMDVGTMLSALSSDKDCRAELLGFDPETGNARSDEEETTTKES